jgi:hypothetical protein
MMARRLFPPESPQPGALSAYGICKLSPLEDHSLYPVLTCTLFCY